MKGIGLQGIGLRRRRMMMMGEESISGYILLTATTDTGLATYSNGSRLFLPAATNYCTNPSFVEDSNADGLADACSVNNVDGITVTKTIETVVIDGKSVKAQHIRLVGGVGANNWPDISGEITAVGTFVQNDIACFSFYLKIIEISGCSLNSVLYFRNAAGANLGTGPVLDNVLTAIDSDFIRRHASKLCPDATMSCVQWSIYAGGNFHDGDVLDFYTAMIQVEKEPLYPFFDGSYPNCAWTGVANASTSTRTADELTYAGVVSIGSAGPVALAGQTIYKRNLDVGYYGPVIITPVAKSDAIAAEIAKSYSSPIRLWRCLGIGDILILFTGGNVQAYEKIVAESSSPIDYGFVTDRIWVRKGALVDITGECSVIWNGTIWQMWSAQVGKIIYHIAPNLLGPWTYVGQANLVGGGALAARAQVRVIGGNYHLLVTSVGIGTQIDHYTSADGGKTWAISAAAILTVGANPAWDDVWFGNTEYWEEGGTYYLLYEGGGASAVMKLGLATAADLDGPWTKHASNPVLGTEACEAGSPCVLKRGATYYCWFIGGYATQVPTDILLSTSTDLLTWTTPQFVLVRATADEGVGGPTGQVADPEVIELENVLYMFYMGITSNPGGTFTPKMAAGYLIS